MKLYKEVPISRLMKEEKKVVLHLIISEIKKGKNPAAISKENNIKKTTLQYYLRQLKEKGLIEKQGYGVWKVLKEVPISTKVHKIHRQIRGHAFNWKIRFKQKIDWKKRLDEQNKKYQLIGINGSTPRLIFKDKKIWFTKTGLVIYEPKSFFSQSSLTSKGQAVWEMDKIIKALGRCLKINLDGYQFTTSREHYSLMDNQIAKQYNDKGEKLYIQRKNGSKWMWIDFSHSINELENDEPIVNRQVQNWFNDHKKHKFEVTPSFLLESLNKLKENFEMAQKEIFQLKKENQDIKQSLSFQKDIRDVNPPSYIQ